MALKPVMQAIISLTLMGSGLYVMLTVDWNANPQLIAAASGWTLFTAGYWLK